MLGDQGCDHLREGIVAAFVWWDQLHQLRVNVFPQEASLQQCRHLRLLQEGGTKSPSGSGDLMTHTYPGHLPFLAQHLLMSRPQGL